MAARDGGTGRGAEGSCESPQAGSSNSGGGPQAAWFAALPVGLKRPLREAPPLIVAALTAMTRRGCPSGPHYGTRAHRSGPQTMRSERGCGASRSEQRADGLASHRGSPPPPAWWPPPPGLHWPPTPPLGMASHARRPHSSSRPEPVGDQHPPGGAETKSFEATCLQPELPPHARWGCPLDVALSSPASRCGLFSSLS